MDVFSDLLGNGDRRPPAPEVADVEDVERYNIDFMKAHGMSPNERTTGDPEESPFAKQDSERERRNVTHRARFPWLYDPSRGVRWDFDPIRLRNLSQTNTWVGMLVQSITKEIAETPWTIVGADGRTETQKRLSTHPADRTPVTKDAPELPDAASERIHDLLMRPNPDLTWQDMVEMWMGDMLEIGSLTTIKAFRRSAYDADDTFTADPRTVEPRALVPSAPEVWTKDYNERTSLVEQYWQFDDHRSPGAGSTEDTTVGHRAGGSPDAFDVDEMIWSDMTPRTNRRYGIPPTLLVEDFLESLDLAVVQEQQYLSRGSIPSGAWVFEEWDRKELKERKEQMEENVTGKPHKSLMFAGQGGDVSFEPMSMNFQELEFTERMKWYARVVSSAFQVPTAVVGIEPEQINYSTFQGERENFESNTLGPYLQKLERIINMDLIRPHWGAGSYRFEFKPGMSESTRAMISDRIRGEFDSNIRTRNEARREIGLGEVPPDEDGFKDEVVEGSDDNPLEDMGLSVDTRETLRGIESRTGADGAIKHDGKAYVKVDGEWHDRSDMEYERSFNQGSFTPEQWDDPDFIGQDADGNPIHAGDSGNANPGENPHPPDDYADRIAQKDEPLRETDEWADFDVQPHMVEQLTDEIADDVRALFDRVMDDDAVMEIIDRLAVDDATEKSLSALNRRLRELFEDSDVVARIQSALRDETARAARETVETTLSDAGEQVDTDVDVDAIEAQLRDREVEFADAFVNEMQDDILDTVGDGWADGQSTQDIADEIAEQADINEGWQGAEKIARQELHIATGEARSEVAGDLDKIEVWQTSGDGRVRPAHQAMQGTWKRPGESWVVAYEDRGVEKESTPGDSRPGIGCRCTTLIRDRAEVDDDDYAGDRGLN